MASEEDDRAKQARAFQPANTLLRRLMEAGWITKTEIKPGELYGRAIYLHRDGRHQSSRERRLHFPLPVLALRGAGGRRRDHCDAVCLRFSAIHSRWVELHPLMAADCFLCRDARGGNAKQFDTLPAGIVPGDNRNVYLGGLRMWETDPKTRRAKGAVL